MKGGGESVQLFSHVGGLFCRCRAGSEGAARGEGDWPIGARANSGNAAVSTTHPKFNLT